MSPLKILILVLSAAVLLGACSGNKPELEGPLALSDDQLGPETEELVKSLPEGLVGDTVNARHSSQQLRGEDEDDGN